MIRAAPLTLDVRAQSKARLRKPIRQRDRADGVELANVRQRVVLVAQREGHSQREALDELGVERSGG
jgi:hypothetical protein